MKTKSNEVCIVEEVIQEALKSNDAWRLEPDELLRKYLHKAFSKTRADLIKEIEKSLSTGGLFGTDFIYLSKADWQTIRSSAMKIKERARPQSGSEPSGEEEDKK